MIEPFAAGGVNNDQKKSNVRRFIPVMSVLLLSACASTEIPSQRDLLPAYVASIVTVNHPVSGTFLMRVRGTGKMGDLIFLNSEPNFRSPQCLTIAIPSVIATKLAEELAGDPAGVLHGKLIRVTGTARRVPIWTDGEGNTHFQTHVVMTEASQLNLVSPNKGKKEPNQQK